jgi:hypothetical protein
MPDFEIMNCIGCLTMMQEEGRVGSIVEAAKKPRCDVLL